MVDLDETKYQREATLMAEVLCREMAQASRWTHLLDAWAALLNVRRMERQHVEEIVKRSARNAGGAAFGPLR